MLHVRVNAPAVPAALEALAEGIVRLNCWYLEQLDDKGVDVPSLYESNIVYRREPPGQEWWETVADAYGVATQRSGDCEDLSNLRVAELRTFYDEPGARTRVVPTRRGTFHAIVQRQDGTFEDPSRLALELESMRTGRDIRELAKLRSR